LILDTDYSGHSVLYKVEAVLEILVSVLILKLQTATYYKVLYNQCICFLLHHK